MIQKLCLINKIKSEYHIETGHVSVGKYSGKKKIKKNGYESLGVGGDSSANLTYFECLYFQIEIFAVI